ncbi:MAG: YebC/PmpR family DNA-binding transcriptional regulator [Planctomycetes bacterium]|nr:YebC/PmpR family DNA-binding transcriptional regulator [Planctomycetota bacterium]
MAGHSHWAGIKHKKAINDKKRGKVFSRLAKHVYIAVKEGGSPKPEDNPRLRLVLEKCRQANMPKDNIKRAIDKAMDAGVGYEEMTLEGYGAGGAAVIAECLTDNTNRTGPEVKKIFEKAGAKPGQPGCVSYMFQRKGLIQVSKEKTSEEHLFEIALEAGADDVVDQGDFFEVTCGVAEYMAVNEALETAGIETEQSDIQLIPDNNIDVDIESARKLMKLTEMLEEHDDVQNVYTNFDISEEVAAQLAAEAE